MSEFVINCIVSAVISGVVGGLIFGGFKNALDKKLKEQEEMEKELEKYQKQRRINTSKKWSAVGRMFYHVQKEIDNDDITKAYEEFHKAAEDDKELDKQIIADYEVNNKNGRN